MTTRSKSTATSLKESGKQKDRVRLSAEKLNSRKNITSFYILSSGLSNEYDSPERTDNVNSRKIGKTHYHGSLQFIQVLFDCTGPDRLEAFKVVFPVIQHRQET